VPEQPMKLNSRVRAKSVVCEDCYAERWEHRVRVAEIRDAKSRQARSAVIKRDFARCHATHSSNGIRYPRRCEFIRTFKPRPGRHAGH
jgi:hypothetical protein